jgi:hypothetical protein
MLIERARDAVFINRLANDPAVRPYMLAPPGPIDFSSALSGERVYGIQGEHGAMLFHNVVPQVFEIHTMILPDGRGPWALEFARAAVDWLFCRTAATEVYTRVPEGNVAAMALTRACGAKPEQKVTQNINGMGVPLEIYSGRLQDWVRIAPGLEERGKTFHVKLVNKYAAMGITEKVHPEDPWHNRHVGAAVGMILGGQFIKGVLIFNRWAAMALAPAMRIVSQDPLVLDISDCRIEVQGDDFEIVPGSVR